MTKKILSVNTVYSSKQLFDMVLDIESYAMFLPWCAAAQILEKHDKLIIAELLIKYKIFRSSYISKVTFVPYQEINVDLIDGPFKYLYNHWQFTETSQGSLVQFILDFELKSNFLEQILSSNFDKYTDRILSAFLKRADTIYAK